MSNLAFTNALLQNDTSQLASLGVKIIGQSPVSEDAGIFTFGGTQAYEQAMEDIIFGNINEVTVPIDGDIAVYTDVMDNVVHVGKAESESGQIRVLSTITGSSLIVKHRADLVPTNLLGSITLRWYRK